jgi:TMEM175 potassium channel family protein
MSHPSHIPGITTSRVESFSDGVFSIAATLLVLQLHVPTEAEGDFGHALLAQWPSYASYVVSFMTIGIIWINHHTLFANIRRIDRPLLLMNLLLLLSVSTIPFPTALLGQYIGRNAEASHLAAAIYGAVMLSMSLSFTVLWGRVSRDRRRDITGLNPRRPVLRSLAGLGAYTLGILLAFVSAEASLLVYGSVALFYVLPPVQD